MGKLFLLIENLESRKKFRKIREQVKNEKKKKNHI